MYDRMTVVPSDMAEIIEIGDLERTERLGLKDQPWDACKHRRTWIDERLRVVDCKDCGARLDPVEVLIDIARAWRSESMHARRIVEFERKSYDEATERDKRFVRQHIVCHGCGLQSRLTIGRLTPADLDLWGQHWGTEPEHPAPWDATKRRPELVHRRRVEADIEASRRLIEPVPIYGGASYVERAPAPGHNTPRLATPAPLTGDTE
jgi:hypothetical protein